MSADEHAIEAARQRVRAEEVMALIEELRGQVRTGGRKSTRDEMNER